VRGREGGIFGRVRRGSTRLARSRRDRSALCGLRIGECGGHGDVGGRGQLQQASQRGRGEGWGRGDGCGEVARGLAARNARVCDQERCWRLAGVVGGG